MYSPHQPPPPPKAQPGQRPGRRRGDAQLPPKLGEHLEAAVPEHRKKLRGVQQQAGQRLQGGPAGQQLPPGLARRLAQRRADGGRQLVGGGQRAEHKEPQRPPHRQRRRPQHNSDPRAKRRRFSRIEDGDGVRGQDAVGHGAGNKNIGIRRDQAGGAGLLAGTAVRSRRKARYTRCCRSRGPAALCCRRRRKPAHLCRSCSLRRQGSAESRYRSFRPRCRCNRRQPGQTARGPHRQKAPARAQAQRGRALLPAFPRKLPPRPARGQGTMLPPALRQGKISAPARRTPHRTGRRTRPAAGRSKARRKKTAMHCIKNTPSIFLYRGYRELLPGETAVTRCGSTSAAAPKSGRKAPAPSARRRPSAAAGPARGTSC